MPLQVLLRKKPEWKDLPVVVIDRDATNGTIQHVNKRGRAYRILPGMAYGAGLSLCSDLRGGISSLVDIEDAVTFLTKRLWLFSPRVEPSQHEPGIFWLDPSGLRRLFASLGDWANAVRADLRDAGFYSVVAVGFTRFGSYACARSKSGSVVFDSTEEENLSLRATPIKCLNINPRSRDLLFKLGITSLGGFIDLPADGIRRRFGPDIETLHEMARGTHWRPLQPSEFREPVERTVTLEHLESNTYRLLFIVARLLNSMLRELSQRYEALKTLSVKLDLGDGREHICEVSPSMPTLDHRKILSLLRLRLERLVLSAGVEEIKIRTSGERASQFQRELFGEASIRHLELANQAIAKLRAFLNQDAIVCARLRDGHLPEAQYYWKAVHELRSPRIGPAGSHTLARRVFSPPVELPPRPRHEPDGWMVAGPCEEPVEEMHGRYAISGGWWVQEEIARDYYYVRTKNDRLFWIYYDQKRRRWFLHGEVD